MKDEQKKWENELMEEEDALMEEMKQEFKTRLKQRLQKKIHAREEAMLEIQRLKKNAQQNDNSTPPLEK
jgi:hypothetical protein